MAIAINTDCSMFGSYRYSFYMVEESFAFLIISLTVCFSVVMNLANSFDVQLGLLSLKLTLLVYGFDFVDKSYIVRSSSFVTSMLSKYMFTNTELFLMKFKAGAGN